MPITNCRVCAGPFFKEALLTFTNMPKAAQHLPTLADLINDKGIDLEVCQCQKCGLVQLTNDPVPYYKDVIRASAFSGEMKAFREDQFKDFVHQYSLQDKKVIEIGTGKGEYLSLMKDAGAKAYGIEHAQESVDECLSAGLQVTKEYINHWGYRLRDAPFDAFFILNFFEHIPDPNATLSSLHLNLADDGLGLIEVPNFDMILKNNLFTEFIGDHLFYFTKETLAYVLEKNGFEVLECKEIWYDYIISATVRKRQKTDISSFDTQRQKLQEEIDAYTTRHNRVAVWGAGHQALAVLSLLDLEDKVEYVVDSAPFKQGKYTPATHIPIFPPDTLNVEPVDAIIIMAASYSDSVARKVRSGFDPRIHVAILRDYGLERNK